MNNLSNSDVDDILNSLGIDVSNASVRVVNDNTILEAPPQNNNFDPYNLLGEPEHDEEISEIIEETDESETSSLVEELNDNLDECINDLPNVHSDNISLALSPVTEEEQEQETDIITNNVELLPDTLFDKPQVSRFLGLEWTGMMFDEKCVIIGLGGIGSHLAFLLSRLNMDNMLLIDDDIVESHNLSGQMFTTGDVGKPKVSAVKEMCRHYSNNWEISTWRSRLEPSNSHSTILRGNILCGVDNMESRKQIFDTWEELNKGLNNVFIDGRLNAEEFQVFCITGNDEYHIEKYKEEWLFDDDDAVADVCSAKQTTHCAHMIASVMTNLFVNFVNNKSDLNLERPLPFFTYYNAKTMQFIIRD